MKIYLLLLIALKTIAAKPYGPRTVMFGGYYGGNPYTSQVDTRSQQFPPPSTMTFAAGDTIATNAFVGDERSIEENATDRKYLTKEEFDDSAESSTRRQTKAAVPKRRPQKPQNHNEEEEEDSADDQQGNWPFQGSKKGGQSYNAFFPIMFGGARSKGRNGQDDDGGFYPGSATAIANSFSTGKGGVATSHATSFGDPYLSTLLRNGGMNFNRKA